MKKRPLSLNYKIVLPFTLLFAVLVGAASILSVSMLTSGLERRIEQQMIRISEIIARSDFALDHDALERLKVVGSYDILVYREDGEVLSATRTDSGSFALLNLARSTGAAAKIAGGASFVVSQADRNDRPYKLVIRPFTAPASRTLPKAHDAYVAFVRDVIDVRQLETTITRWLMILVGTSIVLMFFVGLAIARSIVAPLEKVVECARRLAAGERPPPIEIAGRDEIGGLTEAFNDLVQRLRESEERLVRTERLAVAGRFAAGVAHDIRNPLSSIKMGAQLLRTRLRPGPENQELVQVILRESDRVEWVVKGLLQLASATDIKLETGRVEDVLERVTRLSEAQLSHRNVEFRKRYQDGLPHVLLNQESLAHALLNLVVNAAEAMPGGGVVEVQARASDDRSHVIVEIIDEGIGVDPTILDKLFDPLFTTKHEGIGLGLATAQRIVEKHGGTLQLVPRDDAPGIRTIVSLPVAKEGSKSGSQPDTRQQVSG